LPADCREFANLKSVRLPTGQKEALQMGTRIAVGGFGREFEESRERRILGGTSDIAITKGDDGSRAMSTSVAISDVFDGVAGFSNKTMDHITEIGIEKVPTLQLGGGDSGAPVYLDDRAEGVNYEDHTYLTVIGVNSFSTTASSFFTTLDWQRSRHEIQCIRSIVTGERNEIQMQGDVFGEICHNQTSK